MKKKQFYRIEGGSVQVVEETVKETIATDDFLEAIRSQSGISTGILPKDCFYFQRKISGGNRRGDPSRESSLFVIQKEPTLVNVNYKHCGAGSRDNPVERLRISLPFVLFFIITNNGSSMGDVYACCSKVKIKSLTESIYVLPLPNLYDIGHGKLCTGSIRLKSTGTIQEKVEEMCLAFWNSGFNTDLSTEYPAALQVSGRNGMQAWADKSKSNPFFGFSNEIEYNPHQHRTFKGMIERLGFPT